MSLVLTEDQQILKQSAADFVKKESPVSRFRSLRDNAAENGFSREIWAKIAQLGWPAIPVPEQYGGLSMGALELACVMEECGRNLVPEPLLSTVAFGANLLVGAASEAQKEEILPHVAAGQTLLAVAYQEATSRYNPLSISTRADKKGDGYLISGEKILVLDGPTADLLIVSARTSGGDQDRQGVSLFLVPPDAPGVEVARQSTVDCRSVAIVRLHDVEIDAAARIGAEGDAAEALCCAIDRATAALTAEMLGNMSSAFEMTLDYLKTREQFGVAIGSFQALKHRAALMFIEIELARSAVLGACEALDNGASNARSLVSVAKSRCSDAAMLVGYEGVQMHGGIGMTDEHDIGFYLKRARGSEIAFGDSAFHRDRFAQLNGF
jgi:alkylation response protein AidB-like acyl-CoA dehydrogenase